MQKNELRKLSVKPPGLLMVFVICWFPVGVVTVGRD